LEGATATAAVGGGSVRCFTLLGGDIVFSDSARFGVALAAFRMANMASTLGLGAMEGDFAHVGFKKFGGHFTGISNSKLSPLRVMPGGPVSAVIAGFCNADVAASMSSSLVW
jgi:hypothetical protein